ncbi:HAD family phosphatase [Neobacillus notoginsengisoli]|uniref:HAD family phosphatase n=1 Tax=Neobacillus notoginsengisoli TaxID=1578198 RepID=A0A417YT92_9BACI|nr:Cof-type HAD-IIB family hydrolase [Neobacillus notoginsengisoli]RHW40271.1 HAD family phosphatase [Neobacillus notoginsengisoli]
MIRCIASDMDGTLLTAGQEITPETKEAIFKAQQLGVEFVVATGRSYQEARFVLEEAGVSCPMICVNGAEVRDADGAVVSTSALGTEEARDIAARLAANGVYFELYTNKGTYTDSYAKALEIITNIVLSANPGTEFEKAAAVAEERFRKGLIEKVGDYQEVFGDPDTKILKLLAFSLESDKLDAAKTDLEGIQDIAISSSGADNLEITAIGAQKGLALKKFVEGKGISLQETMALGDNYNDVSMFERVGVSVAMENAPGEIKELCSRITETNEESGVAKAIVEALGL